MQSDRNRRTFFNIALPVVLLLSMTGLREARSDDLVTLSGITYHDVRPMRVEPDGVTWQYEEGICKVDFADCPESVRRTYHYDPAKAAAYHTTQAQARQEVDERTRQILQDNEARRLARLHDAAANGAARSVPGADMIFRRAASPAASEATRALGDQLAAAMAKQAAISAAAAAIQSSKIGSVLTDLGILHYSHPAEVANADEYKTNLHHAPGPFVSSSAQDDFYQPNYVTKSYYDDVDRSAAFLRDVPLKQ